MSSSSPPPMRPPSGSQPHIEGPWDEWARLVLWRLDQVEIFEREAARAREKHARQLAVLQTKVTMYSAGVALIVSAIIELAVKLFAK